MRAATDEARKDRDTLGGIVEVVATGVPPGLGSYAEKSARLDARLAAALMGIQAVKGVEIGDGFDARPAPGHGGARRDRPRARAANQSRRRDRGRDLEWRADRRACRDEAAADPDASARLGRPLERRAGAGARRALATCRRSKRSRSSPRPRSRSSSPVRRCEKLGGDALVDVLAAHAAYLARIGDRWRPRT